MEAVRHQTFVMANEDISRIGRVASVAVEASVKRALLTKERER